MCSVYAYTVNDICTNLSIVDPAQICDVDFVTNVYVDGLAGHIIILDTTFST